MKSLLGFALLLLLISGLGYFALLNNHNVAVHLYGSFTLQFAVWTMILGCFALGFLLSESRFLFSSPQSWINRLRKIWKNRGERQRLGRQDHFRKALLEGNYAEMEKNFRLLHKDPETLIHLKIQHLEQLRFFESKEEVFRRYDEAISDQPNQLELELSFFRMLLWQKDWSGLEEHSTRMKKKFPDHPEVLEGLSRMM
ncbi:MAG: LapA family protein, partial [bacterium]